MNKQELKKAFEEGLIDQEKYKEELFKIETAPKDKKRKEKRLPKSVTSEEFKNLIKVIPEADKISRVSFLLAYAAGLRISEIVGSKKGENVIPALIKDQIRSDSILIYGKYSKERVVPLPKGWKQWMTDLLPINKTSRTLERNFKNYSKKAGLDPEYSFHSLRHGFAVRLVESGVPMNQVQLLMGHDNLATTSIYSKARPLDALKSYEELF